MAATRQLGRKVQRDGVVGDANNALAVGALEFRVSDRGVFRAEEAAAKAVCFLNDPVTALIASHYETERFRRDFHIAVEHQILHRLWALRSRGT